LRPGGAFAMGTANGIPIQLVEPPAARSSSRRSSLSHVHWTCSHPFGCRSSPAEPFKKRTHPVSELLALDDTHIRHPIQLDHPARAFEGMKAMPRIGLVLE